jgi:hypothetical protein
MSTGQLIHRNSTKILSVLLWSFVASVQHLFGHYKILCEMLYTNPIPQLQFNLSGLPGSNTAVPYLGGARSESREGHCLPSVTGFRQSLQTNTGILTLLRHYRFSRNLFQFITNHFFLSFFSRIPTGR